MLFLVTPAASRAAFLSALGCIYLCAFLSFWVQYDGLLGTADGLLPVDSLVNRELRQVQHRNQMKVSSLEEANLTWAAAWQLWRQKPLLAWFSPAMGGLPFDALHDAAALLGAFFAALAALRCCQHGLVFALLFVLYLGLYNAGSTFFSFQWDILLLEVGFASILYAPWSIWPFAMEPSGGSSRWNSVSAPAAPTVWPLRCVLTKLMFMSGVVKVQALCPTWLRLTALEYHFATQCIPTPLAWWGAQLPPLFLRLGVAATLVLEIPAPLLLLAPWASVRRLGATLQFLLQVLIAATGNYGFFNALTAALCIPVAAHDFDTGSLEKLALKHRVKRNSYLNRRRGLVGWLAHILHWSETSSVAKFCLSSVTWAALAAVAVAMIAYKPWPNGQSPWQWALRNKSGSNSANSDKRNDDDDMEGGGFWLSMLPLELDQWVAFAVPWSVGYALAMTLIAGLQYALLQWVLVDVEDDENEDDEDSYGSSIKKEHDNGSENNSSQDHRTNNEEDNPVLSQRDSSNSGSSSHNKSRGNQRNTRSRSWARWLWAWARKCGRLVHACIVTALALAVVTLVAVPLVQLHPSLQPKLVGPRTARLWHYAAPYSVSSGYGLFRRMTGVGNRDAAFRDQWQEQQQEEKERAALLLVQEQGGAETEAANAMAPTITAAATTQPGESRQWAWLYPGPPSVVGRPEVVLEGLIPGTGHFGVPEKWVEIPFLYKPSDPYGNLPWVAPHQPRLDWQMWFAALSAYQNEPWFVHLAAKLLSTTTATASATTNADTDSSNALSSTKSNGSGNSGTDKRSSRGSPCPSVLDLLDAANYPFNASTGPPAAVRASRYAYDFTRLNTPWAQHQANPSLVPAPLWLDKIWKVVESWLNDDEDYRNIADANGALKNQDAASVPMKGMFPVDKESDRGHGQSSSVHQSPTMFNSSSAVWTRRYVGSYLPAISLSDPSLNAFLAHHGFPPAERGCARPNLNNFAEACTGVSKSSVGSSSSSSSSSRRRSSGDDAAKVSTAALGGRESVCNAIVASVARARLLKHRPGYEWRAAAAVMALLVLLRARKSRDS